MMTSGSSAARLGRDLLHLAAAEQRRGHRPGQRRDVAGDHVQTDGGGQPDRFRQPRLGVAVELRSVRAFGST